MSTVSLITEQCLGIIKQSTLPPDHRNAVELKILEIKRLLESDQFNNTRCDFFSEAKFENLLHQVQQACSEPHRLDVIPAIVSSTTAILSQLRTSQH